MALFLGSKDSFIPRPLICEWAPILSILVTSLTYEILGWGVCIESLKLFKLPLKDIDY